jgi:hypothetical protein
MRQRSITQLRGGRDVKMKTGGVLAPASLLLDSRLPASAKVVWLVSQINTSPGPVTSTLLVTCSGLSRTTVLKGLAQLAAAGWALSAGVVDRAPSDARVSLPTDLLQDRRVGVQSRVLYGALQLTPEFHALRGQFTFTSLSSMTGASPKALRQAVRDLVTLGWLQITQLNRRAPICFSLGDPTGARGQAEIAGARKRLKRAEFVGEALMREYLTLLIDSQDYEDDALPGFLVNPFTGERMQLDRYYTAGIAFEFNGPQHYIATERYSEEDELARQQARDIMKAGICRNRGIQVQVVHPEDLSLKVMRQKVGTLLPMRELNGHEPLLAFLELEAQRYRSAAMRWMRL